MDDKLEKLMELLEEISEIYPSLDKIILNDPDNPDYIVVSTTEYLNNISEMFGIADDFEDLTDDVEVMDTPVKKKGPLQ